MGDSSHVMNLVGASAAAEPSLEEFRQTRRMSSSMIREVDEAPVDPGLVYWDDYWIGVKNNRWYSACFNDQFSSFDLAEVEEWLYKNIGFTGPKVWKRREDQIRQAGCRLIDLANSIERGDSRTSEFADGMDHIIDQLIKTRNGEYDEA